MLTQPARRERTRRAAPSRSPDTPAEGPGPGGLPRWTRRLGATSSLGHGGAAKTDRGPVQAPQTGLGDVARLPERSPRQAVRWAPATLSTWLALTLLAGCSRGAAADEASEAAAVEKGAEAPTDPELRMVGYDVRRLRPREGEPLSQTFERMRARAAEDGKLTAVLFSAEWCEPCRVLKLELGNLHPAASIAHVRILELVEEDWDAKTRMNEFNDLRRRWSAPLNVYPLFVLLDRDGAKIEEMQEAKTRLEGMGIEPTIDQWFEGHRPAS